MQLFASCIKYNVSIKTIFINKCQLGFNYVKLILLHHLVDKKCTILLQICLSFHMCLYQIVWYLQAIMHHLWEARTGLLGTILTSGSLDFNNILISYQDGIHLRLSPLFYIVEVALLCLPWSQVQEVMASSNQTH